MERVLRVWFKKRPCLSKGQIERWEVMNIRYLKTMVFLLAFVFLSSCAVIVKDDDGFHRRHRRDRYRHSSLQQSNPSIAQMTVQDSIDSGSGQEVSR